MKGSVLACRPILSYNDGICLKVLRTTTKNIPELPVRWPRFESGISQIRSANHSITTFRVGSILVLIFLERAKIKQLKMWFANNSIAAQIIRLVHCITSKNNSVYWGYVKGEVKKSVLYSFTIPNFSIQWLQHNATEIWDWAVLLEGDVSTFLRLWKGVQCFFCEEEWICHICAWVHSTF